MKNTGISTTQLLSRLSSINNYLPDYQWIKEGLNSLTYNTYKLFTTVSAIKLLSSLPGASASGIFNPDHEDGYERHYYFLVNPGGNSDCNAASDCTFYKLDLDTDAAPMLSDVFESLKKGELDLHVSTFGKNIVRDFDQVWETAKDGGEFLGRFFHGVGEVVNDTVSHSVEALVNQKWDEQQQANLWNTVLYVGVGVGIFACCAVLASASRNRDYEEIKSADPESLSPTL